MAGLLGGLFSRKAEADTAYRELRRSLPARDGCRPVRDDGHRRGCGKCRAAPRPDARLERGRVGRPRRPCWQDRPPACVGWRTGTRATTRGTTSSRWARLRQLPYRDVVRLTGDDPACLCHASRRIEPRDRRHPAVMTLGWFLPSLFVAPHTESLPRKLPFMLRYTLWERLPLPALAAVAFFVADPLPRLALALVLLLLLLMTGVGGALTPAWMDVIGRTIPTTLRGRFFGAANVLASAGGLLGAWDGLPPRRLSGAGELRPVLPRGHGLSRALVRRTGHRARAGRPLPPGRACRWPPISVASRRCSAATATFSGSSWVRGAATLGRDGKRVLHRPRPSDHAAPEWQVVCSRLCTWAAS